MTVLPFPAVTALPRYPVDPYVNDLIWCLAVMDARDPDLIRAYEILAAPGSPAGTVTDEEWEFSRQLARRLRSKHGYSSGALADVSVLAQQAFAHMAANVDAEGRYRVSVGALARRLEVSPYRARAALWALHRAWIVDLLPWNDARTSLGWTVALHVPAKEASCAS